MRPVLPLGISFLTFQKLAFLADVHSGEIAAVSLCDFLLFTLFFPRAIAGPIVHYQEIVPQFARITAQRISTNLAVGVCLFSIGLFKKVVIADGLAPFVSAVFDPPLDASLADPAPGLLAAWASILAYTFQLYFDFSGYSDMALGSARLVGIRLPMNFNSPFKATSVAEFWGRWHITLTRFLTAYIYTPLVLHLTRARLARGKSVLQGKRSTFSALMRLLALPTLVTMTISGLWHGAGWPFVCWGALHGIYLTINQSWRLLRPRFWPAIRSYDRVMQPLGWLLTFIAVVIALAYFRASSVAAASTVLAGMAGLNGVEPHNIQLLERLGGTLPASRLLPRAFEWIFVLLLLVTRLPNSLELLRRFQPALDSPPGQEPAATTDVAPSALREAPGAGPSRARQTLRGLLCPRSPEMSLTWRAALFIALLTVLGLLGLQRGGAFLYGQF
jgi:alginate O-acetyltransferase complex protein AlgI